MTRTFLGRTFYCERPGAWVSRDGLGIYQMLTGTPHEAWEVYRCVPPDSDPIGGDHIASGLTMGEAIDAAAEVLGESP